MPTRKRVIVRSPKRTATVKKQSITVAKKPLKKQVVKLIVKCKNKK